MKRQIRKLKKAFQGEKAPAIVAGTFLFVIFLTGLVLSSPITKASNTETSNVSVIVNSACSITTGGGSYAKVISPGTTSTITGNGINVTCNDSGGYDLYAVGFSGDSLESPNNTRMLTSLDSNYIATGTSGPSSYWAMKAAGSSSLTPSTAPTIDNGYSSYQNIPSTYTKISHYSSSTLGTTDNSITTPTYEIFVATAQPANTYTGKVKYTLVHPHDVSANVAMQNWPGCSSMAIGSETFLVDNRDNNVYRVVKYNDGKCWMATNLDLAGGTQLTSNDTDMPDGYTLPTTNGFQADNNLPESEVIISGTSLPSTAFSDSTMAYVFNSESTNCASNSPCYSYYSWTTATLGSGLNISTDNTDAPYSICPKGWHLPNTRTGIDDVSDLRKLMIVLGGSSDIRTYSTDTVPTGAAIFEGLTNSPLSFSRGGYYASGSFAIGGVNGSYWSSTTSNATNARQLDIYSTYVDSVGTNNRLRGYSLRCLTE